jgi:hypothetical protein
MQPELRDPSLVSIASGLIFALVIGAAVVPVLKQAIELATDLDDGDRGKRVPGWATGIIERSLFTLVVAYDISGAVPGMMAWIALKMAANWNSVEARLEDEGATSSARQILNRRFTALIASAVAMGIAIVGGLIGAQRIAVSLALLWVSIAIIVFAFAGHLIIRRLRKAAG